MVKINYYIIQWYKIHPFFECETIIFSIWLNYNWTNNKHTVSNPKLYPLLEQAEVSLKFIALKACYSEINGEIPTFEEIGVNVLDLFLRGHVLLAPSLSTEMLSLFVRRETNHDKTGFEHKHVNVKRHCWWKLKL